MVLGAVAASEHTASQGAGGMREAFRLEVEVKEEALVVVVVLVVVRGHCHG